ncbi:MAG TPA: DNA-directed RNA polymerase subunit omega [Miltoncostaeaceae bacterium]|jgi:DNA-directed RNA polymerase subunit K/omega|nr:DNA-directed RNA polymerase subunit omega [Miltoncostaeaceae bacterium]
MLYGRRLDQSLQHVDGSRYALVHAVAKRARQITLWLTADPAELRAEAAPPPAPGELTSRDPVALAEAEILDGEVKVRWDPEGTADEAALIELDDLETDPLLIETLGDDDDAAGDGDDDGANLTPALAQVLEGETTDAEAASADDEEDETEPEPEEDADASATLVVAADDEVEEISLEDVEEPDEGDDEDEAV